MAPILTFTVVTLLLALAVKQLSYALMQGSLFEPLRRYIRDGMRRDQRGFEILSELISCKLCMTMQVSLWFVMIPVVVAATYADLARAHLGSTTGPAMAVGFVVLGSFLYSTAVSALALGLWIHLEYPAKRYEQCAFELEEARRTIEDLQAVLQIETEPHPEQMEPRTHDHA